MTNAMSEVPQLTLGWRLRMSLEKSGVKADDMARQLGVHRGTLTRWTHEIGSPPRGIYLERWAEITKVPLEWLRGPDTRKDSGGVNHRYLAAAAA